MNGANVLAVEIHQVTPFNADISFDLELTASDTVSVIRGPYLQSGTPTSVVVRWRTDGLCNSRVGYGASPAALTSNVDALAPTTEHEIALNGLTPNTTYYYSVGTTATTMAGDASFVFHTAPPPGISLPMRIWVIGDSGEATVGAMGVRDSYLNFTGAQPTDVWLMLGDNAYNTGLDSEYQTGLFDLFPSLLRQTPLWPTIGNHDTSFSPTTPADFPYYNIFTLPTAGEAGGLASGTESYYSFNYGPIHFVCLDSMASDRSPTGPMLTWLQNDLAATTQNWIIAFWHHPPYSKGSHDSDTELELVQMRQNALPILESYGVDLVLTGHSHCYERSFLLDGHYGLSSTLNSAMKKDAGSGRDATAYQKSGAAPAAHQGAVYVVAGTGSELQAAPLDHPAMFISLLEFGSMVVDINGNRLDAKFLTDTGAIADYFTLFKNYPPVAANDTVTTNEDMAIDIAVLANDADPDGNPLTVTSVTTAPNGTVSINPNSTVHYIPSANFNGSDSFSYTISDGKNHSATGLVNVMVTAVNDAPSFSKGANQTVLEDIGPQSVSN